MGLDVDICHGRMASSVLLLVDLDDLVVDNLVLLVSLVVDDQVVVVCELVVLVELDVVLMMMRMKLKVHQTQR